MGPGTIIAVGVFMAAAPPLSHADSGAPPGYQPMTSMLVKYAARCALGPSQSLAATDPVSGEAVTFPGSMGLAPEWQDGACGDDCQERVSACLMSLSNRTGRHVELSLMSAAPTLRQRLGPNDEDLAFPYQEGAFFGNVFSGAGYACRGRDARKAPQVKRFCALHPETCNGVFPLRDAGACQDVCEMSCSRLSNGSERCAAVSCRDPGGRVWRNPITVHLRNKIEAGNADRVHGLVRRQTQLDGLDRGDSARFEKVDFGPVAGGVSELAVEIAAARPGGRIEVWLDGKHRIGTLEVARTGSTAAAGSAGDAPREQVATLHAGNVRGQHALLLKIVSGRDIGRLSTIELR